jgi:hypothetical protein
VRYALRTFAGFTLIVTAWPGAVAFEVEPRPLPGSS